jgi:hypothetical protein
MTIPELSMAKPLRLRIMVATALILILAGFAHHVYHYKQY